jgi:putative phosphoribosyl transferase
MNQCEFINLTRLMNMRLQERRSISASVIVAPVNEREAKMLTQFHDRTEAGKLLAAQLTAYSNRRDVTVLALPRGGVPVAFEVASALHAPLDVIVVRKLGVPWQEELAMGAIATGGVRILNEDVVQFLEIPDEVINKIAAQEQQELERRERLYRGDRPAYDVHGRTVILVDDGIATGATMRAAVAALKQRQPARIIIAVPTAAPSTCDEFAAEVDELVCVIRPEPFIAVGYWYKQFSQTSDEEVRSLLEQANQGLSTTQQKLKKTPGTGNREKRSARATPPVKQVKAV